MEIKDILSKLGIDLANPEAKRGALEAIDAILNSRTPIDNISAGGGFNGEKETEVELDPDLLQPSVKQVSNNTDDADIEIEDEEKILDQIKHKEAEEPIKNTNSKGNDSSSSNGTDDNQKTDTEESDPDTLEASEEESTDFDDIGTDSKDTNHDTGKESDADEETLDSKSDSETSDTESETTNPDSEEAPMKSSESDEETVQNEESNTNEESEDAVNPDETENVSDEDSEDFEDSEDEYDFDFDEDDLLDDEIKKTTEDEETKVKYDTRKIKRERTLAAAKKALSDARAKKVSPALIRELEKSIEALETLTEAMTKSLKDISDDEFNLLINRTLDAIQACGESGLTFTSKEEREAQVKEIKADLAKAETQNELSAEDIAKIRAETQAVKAREKETDKYKQRSAESFKGFQEFLNSLYKAIALQVSNEETRDDTWSAISRRNSGAGVLRQGQKINDLSNKRIPVIDFYFDTSTSWNDSDLAVGMKAVSQLTDMADKGQIKLNIFYFADEVSTTPTRGSTSGWNEIVKNVITTQATNVVVMTDSDMQNWWSPQSKPPLRYTVPGYVWYLWKNGSNAPRLPQDLKGRGGVQQFSFNASDI